MYNSASITITPVANGYIVNLPDANDFTPSPRIINPRDRSIIREQVKIAKEEFLKDDALPAGDDTTIDSQAATDEPLDINPFRVGNTHVFKTFKQAMDFLLYKIQE